MSRWSPRFKMTLVTRKRALSTVETGRLLAAFESDLHDFRGFALGGLELPLAHRVLRGLHQHRVSTEHSTGVDPAVGPHDDFHFHPSVDVHLFSQFRIHGRDTG